MYSLVIVGTYLGTYEGTYLPRYLRYLPKVGLLFLTSEVLDGFGHAFACHLQCHAEAVISISIIAGIVLSLSTESGNPRCIRSTHHESAPLPAVNFFYAWSREPQLQVRPLRTVAFGPPPQIQAHDTLDSILYYSVRSSMLRASPTFMHKTIPVLRTWILLSSTVRIRLPPEAAWLGPASQSLAACDILNPSVLPCLVTNLTGIISVDNIQTEVKS